MAQLKDEYMRERAADLRDLGERVCRNLLGVDVDIPLLPTNSSGNDQWIVITDDLPPSVAAEWTRSAWRHFDEWRSRTSHDGDFGSCPWFLRLLRSRSVLDVVEDGTLVALDGGTGEVFVEPNAEVVSSSTVVAAAEVLFDHYLAESKHPVETLDGYQACLVANVELPSEALTVAKKHNVGIGLFRTEFLFINGMSLFNEEDQFNAYRSTVEAVKPYSVIFRTLDIGGDKFLSQLKMPHELNPFMGCVRYVFR